jgi:ParB family chromosome partitioning protein
MPALLGLPAARQQIEWVRSWRKGLSVRETEALVRRMVEHGPAQSPAGRGETDPNIRKLQDDLAGQARAKVSCSTAQPARASSSSATTVSTNSMGSLGTSTDPADS